MTVTQDRPGAALVPASNFPVVVPGEVVFTWPTTVTSWAITDADERWATAERIKYHAAPWWWRLLHQRPPEPTHLTPYRPKAAA